MTESDIRYIWMNGQLVPFGEAKIHVTSAGAFFGANVFEGIRGYWNSVQQELYCFRLHEHFERFFASMKMMRFTLPYGPDDLTDFIREMVQGNEFREDIHFIMAAYVAESGIAAREPIGLYISPRRRGRMVPEGEGLHCCISSWTRIADNMMPARIKCGANYQNGRLAMLQAEADGYTGAILLNSRGKIAEGPGATFFMVRQGEVITPPVTSDNLESITRSTLITLFQEELDINVQEREIDRTQVYTAEEAFFCGSGFEITPILSVDRLPIGDGTVGPLTQTIYKTYFDIVRGVSPRHAEWRTPMYQKIPIS